MMSLIWWMASLPAAQKGFSELNWVDSPNTYLEGPNGVVAPVQWDITVRTCSVRINNIKLQLPAPSSQLPSTALCLRVLLIIVESLAGCQPLKR